ncbi:MAG: serine hydrolase domain-containing protein [Planctomycetota bacterium]|nr:serine hydrolase domain-containing protein [Planctomycetota bacterium]
MSSTQRPRPNKTLPYQASLLWLTKSVLVYALAFGFSKNLLAQNQIDFSKVEQFLQDSVKQKRVAGGAVLLMKGDTVLFETGFGFSDVNSQKPFTMNTPGVIASISKPMQGTVIFKLVEQGKLEMNRPIDTYLPKFGESKLVSGKTIPRAPMLKELLTHTSGTRRDDDPQGRPWFAGWTKNQPLSVVVDRYASDYPFKAAPGTNYGYSGIGTDIAARVAEVASGKTRNDLLVQSLCQPLGMNDTFYWDNQRTKAYDMPTRYYIGNETKKLRVYKQRPYPEPNTYSSSGGSIISTVHDMSRWLRMIRDQGKLDGAQFLKPETIQAMMQTTNIGKNAYCGFFVRERDADGNIKRIGHTGSSGTNCWIDFEHNCIGIMLTQTRGKDIKAFRIELEKHLMQCIAISQ